MSVQAVSDTVTEHLMVSPSGDTEMVDGVACPVDPMEALQCESCQ